MELLSAIKVRIWAIFFLLVPVAGVRTLNVGIMSRLFYHCATRAHPILTFNWLMPRMTGPGNPSWSGMLSTVDPLILASLDKLLLILPTLFTFFTKTSYLNEEVNCTLLIPSVSVPWLSIPRLIFKYLSKESLVKRKFKYLWPFCTD
jgi:hypothetical protein